MVCKTNPFEKEVRKMKKHSKRFLALLLAMALCISAAACSGGGVTILR